MNSPLLVVMLCCTAIADGANLHPSFGHGSHKQEGRHSKWIVVTTVNHPTETIQRLAAVPGWRLVVVADLKTPVDWELPNVELLTVERQKTLNYKILPLIPNNHYGWGRLLHMSCLPSPICFRHAQLQRCLCHPGQLNVLFGQQSLSRGQALRCVHALREGIDVCCRRKNLGYLWAIQHGATLVYETDDDNVLRLPEPVLMDDMEFYVYNTSGALTRVHQANRLPSSATSYACLVVQCPIL